MDHRKKKLHRLAIKGLNERQTNTSIGKEKICLKQCNNLNLNLLVKLLAYSDK